MITSARAQGVTSLVLFLVLLGATCLVLLTAGQGAATQAAVLSQVEDRGTRTITVRAANAPQDFTSRLVSDLATYDVVESATGFGAPVDVTAAATPGGTRVSARAVTGDLGPDAPAWAADPANDAAPGLPARALATGDAMETLGIPQDTGAVRTVEDGPEYLVTDTLTLPEQLSSQTGTILIPVPLTADTPLTSLIVTADAPEDVDLVTALVRSALIGVPVEDLTVDSPAALADLHQAISGELTAANRTLILATFAASAAASIVLVFTVVLLHRRDYGRRRALGATRPIIAGLVTAQVFFIAVLATAFGTAGAWTLLTLTHQPLPPRDFFGAVALGITTSATLAAVAPALWAAHRDPLTELRVP
ncbi:MAG: hypothetical protein LKI58_00375 [Actinomyces sp.]|nr:FtsX-like permease family protein [Actinomyces sp.]MCI1641474.1 hypothetical protein [Actinomyces sp.]MCI1661782.1 hypothetical protein [Actinomyces sp.]MCI1690530.1 hypothetical protein [Actinomyces sp.]MCI1786511.1 hypothetical protein [Actinomyces sp.]MCI1829968.1 hypothetical protein [Actinomyces sp.]